MEGFPWDDLRKIFTECQRMAKVPNGRIKIAENVNGLSRVHGRYKRQTDGLAIAYSERERELTFAEKSSI